ncbi:hypothetical protein ACFLWY_05295 [Chloroflexota bacterium]
MTQEQILMYTAIRDTFQHVTASPKNAELFKRIYVYKHTSWSDVSEEESSLQNLTTSDTNNIFDGYRPIIPANLIASLTKQILKGLVQLSRKTIHPNQSYVDVISTRFFVVGPIGSGKTTFFNALYSMYHGFLRKNKVVWVRLNLTESVMRELGIKRGLSFNATNILLRHHFQDLKIGSDSIKSTLQASMASHGATRFVSLPPSNLDRLINLYSHRYESHSRDEYSPEFEQALTEHAKSSGFSFIYVIDGLDRLDDPSGFKTLKKEVFSHIFSRRVQGVFLIAARTASFAEIVTADYANQLFGLYGHPTILRIEIPRISELMKRRFKVVVRRIQPTELTTPTESKYAKSRELRRRLITKTRLMCGWLNRGLMMTEEESTIAFNPNMKAFDNLELICGNDRRRAINLFPALCYRFFEMLNEIGCGDNEVDEVAQSMFKAQFAKGNLAHLESYSVTANKTVRDILSRHYHVIEVMLCDTYNRFRHKYDHKVDRPDKICLQLSGAQPYIPSILKATNITGSRGKKYNLLSKYYLLKSILESEHGKYKDELIEELANAVGIETRLLDSDFEELIELGLIEVSTSESLYAGPYPFKITAVGEHILSSLILENAYLQYIVFDIYVPRSCLNDFKEHIESSPNRYREPHKWIAFYMVQVARLIKLVAAVEERDQLIPIDESLSQRMRASFVSTLSRIYVRSRGKPEVLNAINNTFSTYGVLDSVSN